MRGRGKRRIEIGGTIPRAPMADGRRDARLGAGFVDDVEGGFGGAAEALEAGGGDDVANARFSCLRPKTEADFLRARAGRAQERGKGVVHAPDGIEIVF